MDNAQSGHLRRLQHYTAGAFDIAARAYANDEIAPANPGDRYFDFRGSGIPVGRENTPAA
jgi:hypothetical protein